MPSRGIANGIIPANPGYYTTRTRSLYTENYNFESRKPGKKGHEKDMLARISLTLPLRNGCSSVLVGFLTPGSSLPGNDTRVSDGARIDQHEYERE